ncbi:MAG TPA: 2-amino-4-hydroxy-6-hydroxymethyldihydropteridine diphosphokinase [Polyangiales bacterium]
MPRAVLGIGGNLGARRALFRCACALLEAQPGLHIVAVSRLFRTPPLKPPQPDYLNAALALDWVGSPRSLLTITQHVETLLRRQRNERWGSRTLDLDILYWSEGAVNEPGLRVPHPELARRAFALVPLSEVAPDVPHQLGLPAEAIDPAFAPAEPFERALRPTPDGSLSLAPVAEPLELACAFVQGLSRLLAPPIVLRSCSQVLPFVCALPSAGEIELEPLLGQLHQRFLASARHGFFAWNAAITGVGGGGCEGVLVGSRAAPWSTAPAVRWELESGATGVGLRLNCA